MDSSLNPTGKEALCPVGCSSVRFVSRKNSRGFFSPKKLQILSWVGLLRIVRTGQGLELAGLQLTLVKTAKLIFSTRLPGMQGCSRNQGNEFNCGRIKIFRELKSFHLATTSPIESRWSRAKLIRRQKSCESCSAHCTASKLFHHLPAARRVNFWRKKMFQKCSEVFCPPAIGNSLVHSNYEFMHAC